jgi:hypothetical protein
MSKRTSSTASKPLADSHVNHDRHGAKIPFNTESTQPSVLNFLSWIDPPIGVNMSGIDLANPHYKISIMVVAATNGSLLILPFAEPFPWNPMAAPPVRLQYQLTSTLSGDPTTKDFYETMTLTQSSPGSQTIRSRVFLTPQAAAFASPVLTSTATVANPAIIQVSGFVDSTNAPRTVSYMHLIPADGSPDLFLQQPWTT